ncbi:MAG: [LysW]-aminoadipate kinase [Trueperaceae bacterium]|nr:[LysW]-aminoadipate kinase [Trueperaceae bacterium]
MIVVKVGGGEGIDPTAVLDDAAALHASGERVVLVHGGSAETNRVAEALGHPPRFVTSPSGRTSRYTDRATLEIFTMVYRGRLNATHVERLQAAGANAVGLCGADGRLLTGRRKATVRSVEHGKTKLLRGDHTGTVDRVDDAFLRMLLEAGYLPVVTPPALADDGTLVNVDGDRAAAAIATALAADALLLLTGVPGLLRDPDDEGSLVPHVDARDPADADALAGGRMRAKLDGAVHAARGGVARVVIGDARRPTPVRTALAGSGTVVREGGAS